MFLIDFDSDAHHPMVHPNNLRSEKCSWIRSAAANAHTRLNHTYTTINIIVHGGKCVRESRQSPASRFQARAGYADEDQRDHSHGPRHRKEQLYPHLWPREKTYVLESTEEGR